MPFWDSIKRGTALLGHVVVEQIQLDFSKIQKMKADATFYQEKFESLSDEALLRKFKSSSGAQKIACGKILKARGYHFKVD